LAVSEFLIAQGVILRSAAVLPFQNLRNFDAR
jgi:hypothetical protein